jgi:endonuclease G
MATMRLLLAGLAVGLASWAGVAIAADDDCADMLAFTGAPEYKGSDPPDHKILCRDGYVLSHNFERLTPDWVLEVLTPKRFDGNADRKKLGEPFAPDPDLVKAKQKHSDLPDYKASGYDRGHMAPAADMKYKDDAMIESFYLSNMAPQIGPGMNRGIWADLEKMTRRLTCSRDKLVVISGPIYGDKPKSIGDDKVAVPIAFYKILYDPDRKRILAFMLPNKSIDKGGQSAQVALQKFLVKPGTIEDKVGLSFLDKLSLRDRTRLLNMTPAMWSDFSDC